MDQPSPKICVVTPWRISPCELPSTSSDSVDQDSMLMKPGRHGQAARVHDRVGLQPRTASPTRSIRSPRMRDVRATRPGAPVPSYTVPPRMTTSGGDGAAATRAIRAAETASTGRKDKQASRGMSEEAILTRGPGARRDQPRPRAAATRRGMSASSTAARSVWRANCSLAARGASPLSLSELRRSAMPREIRLRVRW